MKRLNYLLAITATILTFSSCNDDESNAPVNEEELITTVTTTLQSGNQTITLISRDLDGDGPNAPTTIVSGPLTVGTTYNGTVKFENELVNPAEDITLEVEEESNEHQLFYQAPSIGTISYSDFDENGKPVGLLFSLTTTNVATTGNLIVTLRHLPNKDADGVANGNITNAGGSTDAQVTYQVQLVN